MSDIPGNIIKLSHENVTGKPYVPQEYPKHVTVGEKIVTVNSKEEEAKVLKIIEPAPAPVAAPSGKPTDWGKSTKKQ